MTFLDKEGVSTLWDKTKELVNDVPIKKGEGVNSAVIGIVGNASGKYSFCEPGWVDDTALQIREITAEDVKEDSDAKNFKYIEINDSLEDENTFDKNGECIFCKQNYKVYKVTSSKYSGTLEGDLFNTDVDLDLSNQYCRAIANVASGDYSHAEGSSTIASGYYSHAEGSSTIASGDYSHAEGSSTIASGYYSHAEGLGTTASGYYSHAEGIFNKSAISSIHQVGIGVSARKKLNAEEIYYNINDAETGNKYLIRIGGYDGTNLYTDTDGTVLNTSVKSVQEVINELQSTVEELKKQVNKRFISRYQSSRYVKGTVSNVDVEAQSIGTAFQYIVYDTVKNIFLAYNDSDKKYYTDWSGKTVSDVAYNQSGNFGYSNYTDSIKAYAIYPSRQYVYFIISENKYYSADEKGVLEEVMVGEDITSYDEVNP